jgi:predicted N-formylglutamate amidohydrolase
MNTILPILANDPSEVFNPDGQSCVVIVCEHASLCIPKEFGDLGLSEAERQSHIAWDPGALVVAQQLAKRLDAKLVASTVSRLVYDCNRPPSVPDAMPVRSEMIDISGNADLSLAQRESRVASYYEPFRNRLAATIAGTSNPVIVTIHSFTPVFHGQQRSVEIGVLHDTDARLADAMMQVAHAHTQMKVELNQPYGPQDGVTHTLKEHATRAGHLNVMLEIRNDLITDAAQQDAMANRLADWLSDALLVLDVKVDATC